MGVKIYSELGISIYSLNAHCKSEAYLPRNIKLVVADKVRVVAAERVEDEGLVRLGDLRLGEAALVRQVHLRGDRARVQAGCLRVQLEVHGLGWLDAQHELVARDVLENPLRDVLELDADLDLRLVERWSSQIGTQISYRELQKRGKNSACVPLPALRMKGTPSHRGLWIHNVVAAYVGQTELCGTVSSSR